MNRVTFAGGVIWWIDNDWGVPIHVGTWNWLPWLEQWILTIQRWPDRKGFGALLGPAGQAVWCDFQVGDCVAREGLRKVRKLPSYPANIQESSLLEAPGQARNWQGETLAVLPNQSAGDPWPFSLDQGLGVGIDFSHVSNRYGWLCDR